MDTSKLITIAVWATIAVVAYEAFRQVIGQTSPLAATGLNPIATAATGATEAAYDVGNDPGLFGSSPIANTLNGFLNNNPLNASSLIANPTPGWEY